MSASSPSLDKIVKSRWLKTYEIYMLLSNPSHLSSLNIPIVITPPHRPKSGTFLAWDKTKGKNKWKKDGHAWVMRKGTNYVREDRETLKLGKQEIDLAKGPRSDGASEEGRDKCGESQVRSNLSAESEEKVQIKCAYTHGQPDSEITPPLLKRRAYWLTENPDLILIHYLDEAKINDNGSCDDSINFQPTNYASPSKHGLQDYTEEDVQFELEDDHFPIENEPNFNPKFSQNMVLDPYENEEEMGFHPYEEVKTEQTPKESLNQFSAIQEVKEENEGSLFSEKVVNYFGTMQINQKEGKNAPSEEQSSVKEQLQYFRSRLDSLEKKVSGNAGGSGSTNETHGKLQLKPMTASKEFDDLKVSFMSDSKPEIDPFSFESIYKQKIEILDFSPEWDYTSGGSKLLICFKPDLKNLIDPRVGIDVYEEIETRFSMSFGDSEVPVKFIQNGVLKCHSPPNPPGYVKLSMLYDGKVVNHSSKTDADLLFQYRESQQSKKKVYVRVKDHKSSLLDSEPREFKVRLIEQLSGLERDLCSYASQNASQTQHDSPTVNFDQLKHLEIKILEKINRGYFIRVIRLILNKMMQLYGLERSSRVLNKRDSDGMALIHYVVCLDYYELIPDLHNIGIDLSLSTDLKGEHIENMIPIVICSAKGFRNTLNELLKHMSNPYLNKEQEVRLNVTGQETVKDNTSEKSIEQHEEEKEENCPLQTALKYEQPEIMEILLRDMSLHKALKTDNSSEADEIEPNHAQLLRKFYNLGTQTKMNKEVKGRLKQILTSRTLNTDGAPSPTNKRYNLMGNAENSISEESVDDDAYFVKNSEGYKIEIITDEMKASGRCVETTSNKNPQNDSRNGQNSFYLKSKIKKSSSSSNKEMDSLVDEEHMFLKQKNYSLKRRNRLRSLKGCIKDLKLVQKIQRNVKRWLLKRQACDISHASDVIQKEINMKFLSDAGHSGINQKDAIILIQRTVRNWLADK